jgi:catechol 2,3-dioxygenase-like lactoylglutathione lyase family enzyme
MGVPPKPDFWVSEGAPKEKLHIAFRADDRAQVDAFYAAAIAAGGTDNGPPGPRPQYHPNYYGAFVLDPDGHNIEAVFHGA